MLFENTLMSDEQKGVKKKAQTTGEICEVRRIKPKLSTTSAGCLQCILKKSKLWGFFPFFIPINRI